MPRSSSFGRGLLSTNGRVRNMDTPAWEYTLYRIGSNSIRKILQSLVSFPGFANSPESGVMAVDGHLMVISTYQKSCEHHLMLCMFFIRSGNSVIEITSVVASTGQPDATGAATNVCRGWISAIAL